MQITLNLLAPEKRAALRRGFVLTYAQTMAFIMFLVAVFISGTFVSIELLLKGTRDDLARQSLSTSEEYDSITWQIKEINGYLDRVGAIQAEFTDWSAVIEALAGAAPRGARFDSMRIAEDGSIHIQGTAPTREDVLIMEQRYNALPFITDVRAPLSNLLQRTNARYEFEMRYIAPEEKTRMSGRTENAP